MATTIQAGFAKLRANLEITGLQTITVSTRQIGVRDAVARSFTVLDSFLAGSYARSTMIAPLGDADIDIFIVLDPSYYSKYTPASLLDRLRKVLLETYTTTSKISRNGQAVTLSFRDFQVDVVPAFNRNGGGFVIPNSLTATWISTDPTVHARALTAANRVHNGNLVPLIKMIRGWNRVINGAFVGFYLELMTMDILDNIRIEDDPSGVRYVFDKGREKIKLKQIDPAGFGNQVNGLSGVYTIQDAISRFETAYGRASRAEQLARENKVAAAFDEWRKIFGNYFPAYSGARFI
jgi:hypothetical protein